MRTTSSPGSEEVRVLYVCHPRNAAEHEIIEVGCVRVFAGGEVAYSRLVGLVELTLGVGIDVAYKGSTFVIGVGSDNNSTVHDLDIAADPRRYPFAGDGTERPLVVSTTLDGRG